jgi:hypothetical protein
MSKKPVKKPAAKKVTPKHSSPRAERTGEEISDEDLEKVSGGASAPWSVGQWDMKIVGPNSSPAPDALWSLANKTWLGKKG